LIDVILCLFTYFLTALSNLARGSTSSDGRDDADESLGDSREDILLLTRFQGHALHVHYRIEDETFSWAFERNVIASLQWNRLLLLLLKTA